MLEKKSAGSLFGEKKKYRYSIFFFLLFFVVISTSPSLNAQDAKLEKARDTITTKSSQKKNNLYDLILSDPRNRTHLKMEKQGWLGGARSNTLFRFGGFVQINFIRDFQNTGYNYGEFIPAIIPIPTDNKSNLAFDPRTTRITFETQTEMKKGVIGTFIEMDFSGQSESGSIQPFFRQAYISWINTKKRQSLLIGQATTTLTDGNIWPETFDLEGPNAMLYLRQVIIRYSFIIPKTDDWIVSIAIEEPNSLVQNGKGISKIPDLIVVANWKKKWGNLRFGTLARQIAAEDDAGNEEAKSFAWAISFSGKLKIPNTKDNFQFQLVFGDGAGRYIQDLGATSEGQDAFYDPNSNTLTSLEAASGFIGYQHWWTDKIRTNVAAGYVEVTNLDLQDDVALKATTYVVANTIYSPFKRFDVGLEYSYGQNKNKILDTGHANRLMLGVKYSY